MYKMDIKEIRERMINLRSEKAELVKQRKPILEQMKDLSEKDVLAEAEMNEFEKLKTEIGKVDEKLNPIVSEIEELTDTLLEIPDNPNQEIPGMPTSKQNSENIEIWKAISDDKSKSEIKVIGKRSSFKNAISPEEPSQDFTEYLRDRVRGYTAKNAMDSDLNSALIPEPLSAEIIDLARNQSKIFQAGARIAPMTSKTLTIARQTGEPAPEWKEENEPHSSGKLTFEPLTFTAKTLIASTKASVELVEDAGNLSQLVQNSLASQIALELDRAALLGSGSGEEPTGIFNTTGVQIKTLGDNGAPLTDYSEFSHAVQAILAKNGNPSGVIYSPRTWGIVDRLTDNTGQPLHAPASYTSLEKFQTSQIPDDLELGTAEDASLAVVADWQQLMIGIRTNIHLEITRTAGDSDSSAWENLQVWFRAYARYDVQLAIPAHFYVINGIIPQ